MKKNFFVRALPLLVLLIAGTLLSVSCNKEKEPQPEQKVTANVSGTVIDDLDNPLEGVTVSFVTADSKKEQQAVATTGSDGKFLAKDVPSTARVVNFTKDGYATASTTIAEAKFASGEITLETVVLAFSEASIEGKVFDLNSTPYAGVTVTCNALTTTTDEDGFYSFSGLTIKDYTLNFSDTAGNTAELSVTADKFTSEGVAYADNITLGSYILPGLSFSEMASAPYWYGNNYAGGVGAFKMQWNHVGFLTAYPYRAVGYRNAAEGISLVSGGDNEGELVSYLYGRKKITSDNCYINLCARTFRAYQNAPAKLNVGVIDLSSSTKTITYLTPQDTYQGLKKMGGGTKTLDVEHNMFCFDLSAFAGKEVGFAIGVMGGYKRLNEEEGYPETPIVRILFADKDMTAEFDKDDLNATFTGEKPAGCDWPGFTKANLRSLMPNPGTSFTGESLGAEDGEYAVWAGTNHLMMSWAIEIRDEATTPLQDNSVFALRAHRSNFNVPTGLMMSRFTNPKKNMTIKARTYDGSKPTYFRVTVVDLSDFSATALAPLSTSTAANALVEGENSTIGLNNDQGTVNDPSKFATLNFDLSAFSGKDVVIAIGNHHGNNLSIYSVDFAD
ncbi:MAG: carboxypeptidase regulatory-like domain-containing protein [Bacteroidales bacterium]|nr:carboxypeptidase regulatory-like domain-containing protein [Bacteroidales bacterium]